MTICDLSIKISRKLYQGNPSGAGLNQRGAAKWGVVHFRTLVILTLTLTLTLT